MRFFDLHCDTLYRAFTNNQTLFEPDYQLSLDRGQNFTKWTQCMAVWLPDDLNADDAFELFQNASSKLNADLSGTNIRIIKDKTDLSCNNNTSVILTVENGSLIGNDLSRIKYMSDMGIKILTLTWNGTNTIGDGAGVDNPRGITPFGIKALNELEQNNIIIDVSHASEPLFYDVVRYSTKPFIATHSNSKSCTNHKRNLTDDQFNIIKSNGGIVGINFCNMFLNQDPANACIDDVIRHTEYFLSLGGEDILAIGSDFDGADMPSDIRDISGVYKIYNKFLRLNYSQNLVDKIFFLNAHNFFVKYFDI